MRGCDREGQDGSREVTAHCASVGAEYIGTTLFTFELGSRRRGKGTRSGFPIRCASPSLLSASSVPRRLGYAGERIRVPQGGEILVVQTFQAVEFPLDRGPVGRVGGEMVQHRRHGLRVQDEAVVTVGGWAT